MQSVHAASIKRKFNEEAKGGTYNITVSRTPVVYSL
jgi:hypothetical protein